MRTSGSPTIIPRVSGSDKIITPKITATAVVCLGRSQRAAAACVAVGFHSHSAHLCSLCFGMMPASTQRGVICVHPGSFMSASLLDAGCGLRIDLQCAVRAVAACSAATCEFAVRSRTRACAHSHRPLLNKAQSTEALTAAARACRAGVGVGYLWPDVEWERRHVAQVWCSGHHKIAENRAATTKERRAAMGGRCPVVSAVGRTGVEQHVVEVQWNTRKRCFSTSPGSPHGPKETEIAVLVRPATASRRSRTAISDGVPRDDGTI